MPLLEFQNTFFINDNKTILKDITMSINQGDYISVVGPSGSGKSTFLKLCCHLISPTKGTIIYKNKSIMEHNPIELRKNIAYCFQTPYLFGETVMDNIYFPYQIRGIKVDLKRAEELLTLFNLDKEYLEKDVKNLSGGEKQRIALIRTLLSKPEILLLDEITSALDVNNTLIVENVIKLLNQNGTTIIWITHNPEQSKRDAHKLLTIEAGKIKSLEVLK
ncbi:ATP-binding cassette domain-containing protein [Clostridium sp. 19966]|uniref:ABC transporter ATP-binding protein n=1 Tax=Clostridium sp. 19966 TaxID=2768166 RepID=UPI0028DDC78E|nr:ATP-binding cassette domain-containing protein [Clostridium sp. 19966]MDT8715967.1 ATP-binding cassette domain-containing protein [Clostridium sp. 19966]